MDAVSLRIPRDTGSFSLGWLDCAQHQAPPSLDEGLDDDLRRSFESSFIDIYPAELFTLPSWTKSEYLDCLDFDRPVVDDGTPSPMLLVSASRIFRSGRLLPSRQPQPDDDVVPSAQRSPLFHYSAQSTPISPSSPSSSCSGGKLGPRRLRPGCSGGSPPPLKVLLSYLRFLAPLYRKVRALRARHGGVATTTAASSGSTSSIQWGHGNADAAIHEAIDYCKKSSGQYVQ